MCRNTRYYFLNLQVFIILLLVFVQSALIANTIPYEVFFEGISNKDLLARLREYSELHSTKEKKIDSLATAERRMGQELSELVKVMKSFAYYDAKITTFIQGDQTPIALRYRINPGELYYFHEVTIEHKALVELDTPYIPYDYTQITNKDLEIQLKKAAQPQKILSAESQVLQTLHERGYPLAKIGPREVIADRITKQVSVKFVVDSGPQLAFGPLEIKGLDKTKEQYIRNRLTWKEGMTYSPSLLESSRDNLENSGLFSSITISYDRSGIKENHLPMVIETSERKPRTIGAGLSWSTTQSFGVNTEWEHRNLGGFGEMLRAEAEATLELYKGVLRYRIPDFLTPNQYLDWILDAQHDSELGFDANEFSLSGIIGRKINSSLFLSYGLELKYIRIRGSDNDGEDLLLSSPFSIKWDTSDNLLNPTSGHHMSFWCTPYTSASDLSLFYVVNRLVTRFYQRIGSTDRFVLAQRIEFGSIAGSSRADVTATNRFYAGSESALRGYSHQSVSPLDSSGDPLGGRSIFIGSIAARFRLGKDLGFVTFFEMGNVYTDILPNFSESMLKSVGVGLRYYTVLGPVRVDLAFPLDRRKGIDDRYQVYFSIGQAF